MTSYRVTNYYSLVRKGRRIVERELTIAVGGSGGISNRDSRGSRGIAAVKGVSNTTTNIDRRREGEFS